MSRWKVRRCCSEKPLASWKIPQYCTEAHTFSGQVRKIGGILAAYSNDSFAQGVQRHIGSQFLAAVMDRWPSYSRFGSCKLPMNHHHVTVFILILQVTNVRPSEFLELTQKDFHTRKLSGFHQGINGWRKLTPAHPVSNANTSLGRNCCAAHPSQSSSSVSYLI